MFKAGRVRYSSTGPTGIIKALRGLKRGGGRGGIVGQFSPQAVWLAVGFLTSSSATRLLRGRAPRLTSDNITC